MSDEKTLDSIIDATVIATTTPETPEPLEENPLECLLEIPEDLPHVESFLDVWNGSGMDLDALPTDEISRAYFVRENLRKAMAMGTKLSLASCELLYIAMKAQYWREWEGEFITDSGPKKRCYESFHEFANHELGLERRKAYTLAEFYGTYVVDAKVPKEIVATLPYSKAMIAKEVITDRNWRTVVHKIRTLSTEALRRWVVRERSDTDTEVKLRRLNVMLSDAQWESVQVAMGLALADIHSEDRGAAMEFICMDFLAGQLDTPGGKDAVRRLNRHVEALERAFKVRFGPPQEVDHDMYKDLLETSLDDVDKSSVEDSFLPSSMDIDTLETCLEESPAWKTEWVSTEELWGPETGPDELMK